MVSEVGETGNEGLVPSLAKTEFPPELGGWGGENVRIFSVKNVVKLRNP